MRCHNLAVEALFHHSPSAPQTAIQCREIIYLKKVCHIILVCSLMSDIIQ
jgi:hypothetical protein